MKITFLGGVGTVTGSKYLVETESTKVLVDCGLFQGLKELRLRNWQKPPLKVDQLDGIILTHAHIDHSGFLPLVVREGYKGPVFCSQPTRDLCHVLLPDCGHINEEDAAYANRKGFSKHKPALPLYTEQDARTALQHLKGVPVETSQTIGDLRFTLWPAGHILGATSVSISHKGKVVTFSGDIGRYTDMLEYEPQAIPASHTVVMESTYGDRIHGSEPPAEALADLIKKVCDRKSVLLIPSFALGRAQLLIYLIHQIFKNGQAPRIPVYLNSPMATQITDLYKKHCDWHRLTPTESQEVFNLPNFVRSVSESKALNGRKGPMIIISASGMITGGRILHHIKQFAPNPENVILLPGYQAPGTRGASLVGGSHSLKIHGEYVPIHADVEHWDTLSAHADQTELMRWLAQSKSCPSKVLLVHGDPQASDNLRRLISENFSCKVAIPHYGSTYEL